MPGFALKPRVNFNVSSPAHSWTAMQLVKSNTGQINANFRPAKMKIPCNASLIAGNPGFEVVWLTEETITQQYGPCLDPQVLCSALFPL